MQTERKRGVGNWSDRGSKAIQQRHYRPNVRVRLEDKARRTGNGSLNNDRRRN